MTGLSFFRGARRGAGVAGADEHGLARLWMRQTSAWRLGDDAAAALIAVRVAVVVISAFPVERSRAWKARPSSKRTWAAAGGRARTRGSVAGPRYAP